MKTCDTAFLFLVQILSEFFSGASWYRDPLPLSIISCWTTLVETCSASSDSNTVDPRIIVMSLLYSWLASTVSPVTLIFDQYSLLGAENNQSHTCPHPQLLASTCTMSTRVILVSVFLVLVFGSFYPLASAGHKNCCQFIVFG